MLCRLTYTQKLIQGWLRPTIDIRDIKEFIARRPDSRQSGPVGHPRDTGLYTRSQMGHDQMTRAERAAERAEIASMLPAFNVAKVIGAVFTIIGFGVFFFLLLPR